MVQVLVQVEGKMEHTVAEHPEWSWAPFLPFGSDRTCCYRCFFARTLVQLPVLLAVENLAMTGIGRA